MLARLLHFQPHRVAFLKAQQIGQARQLVRPAVNLDGLPAQGFGYPNNRRYDAGFAWHSFALATASPLKHRRHDSHTRTIESLRLSGQS
jgi:hypothetical protein